MVNVEKSGLCQSPCFFATKFKLTDVVASVAIFLTSASNISFPVVERKEGLLVPQRLVHRYYSVNYNIDGTLNSVLGLVFSSIADNDCYTYSGMPNQPDKHKFIEGCSLKLPFTSFGSQCCIRTCHQE